jgi:2-methylcitrate dehydratase PrpD
MSGVFASGVLHSRSLEAASPAGLSSTSDSEEVTRRLARFVVASRPADVPQAPLREATRSIINWVGCAVGGSGHETMECALAALEEFSGPRKATVLGRTERLDILHAALMNGISSHVLDFDDTHLETIIHPAGPVASAILALAERQPVSGEDFLHAFVLGVEVECRIGKAVYPSHYDVGWHITGTAGVFGAAAAAGKLLGLDERKMAWALGIAATQSSGLREMFGTMCKAFHPGRAAQNGLAAALLASKGFTSSERSLEAPRGFAHVLATERNFAAITEGLGKTFEISRNTYKPFACGIVIHPVIDGCLQLRNEHRLTGESIERIDLRVHPLVLELTGKKTPSTGLEGKFSVYHSSAVAILRSAAGPNEYTDPVVRDPAVMALRDRVRAEPHPGIREEEAYVTVTLRNGGKLEKHVEHAIGSLERPMSDADLEGKFRDLADGVLTRARSEKLLSLCWSVASLGDVSEIARASVPG